MPSEFVEFVFVVGPAIDGSRCLGVQEADLGLEVGDLHFGITQGAGLLVEVPRRGDGQGEVVAAIWAARDRAESWRRKTRHRERHCGRHFGEALRSCQTECVVSFALFGVTVGRTVSGHRKVTIGGSLS